MAIRTLSRANAPASRRAHLEDIITRAIAMLDAMEWDADMEPDVLEEDGDEASLQPLALALTVVPARVVRCPAPGGRA